MPPLPSQPSGVSSMDVTRHWLAVIGHRPGRRIAITEADDLVGYRAAGWTVTGPFVLEAQQPQGAVERVSVLEQALLIACENDEGGAARYVRMAQAVLTDDAGGR